MTHPDLHLHTNASDGQMDAYQLARLVQRAEVTLFSVTDHDTMAVLPAAADWADERGLAFLPGVEISTEGDEEVHILGYGVKADDPALNECFAQMRRDREARVRIMGKRLDEMGMHLPVDEIIRQAGDSVGRPHLGRAMQEAGYVGSVSEAFEKYLGAGKPAYAPRPTPSAEEAIRLLRSRGAVPVLAHPEEYQWPDEKLLSRLDQWQRAGLMGLEVYHPANRQRYAFYDQLARSRGLLVTGGSDFHRENDGHHGQIGETAPAWKNAVRDAWTLYRLVNAN